MRIRLRNSTQLKRIFDSVRMAPMYTRVDISTVDPSGTAGAVSAGEVLDTGVGERTRPFFNIHANVVVLVAPVDATPPSFLLLPVLAMPHCRRLGILKAPSPRSIFSVALLRYFFLFHVSDSFIAG